MLENGFKADQIILFEMAFFYRLYRCNIENRNQYRIFECKIKNHNRRNGAYSMRKQPLFAAYFSL